VGYSVLRISVQRRVGLSLAALVLFPHASHAQDRPWWDEYPTFYSCIFSAATPTEVQDSNATVSFNNALASPGWGPYGQKNINNPLFAAEVRAAGMKNMAYFETFGTSRSVIVELDAKGVEDEFTPIRHLHWNWQDYSGGPIAWAGAPAWFDDMEFARPFTRTHPTLGGQPMRYPDGTVAAGYIGDPANPLNHRVYDAGSAKNILGQFAFKEDFEPVNALVQEHGPYDGLIQINGFWTGHIGPGKDSACPWWTQLDYAMTRLAVENGLDAMWSDNYSSWNSLGYPPLEEGFGDWSVARFRDHLNENFSPAELAAIGVTDLAAFDIRAYLRARVISMGGNDTDFTDRAWCSPAWADDPVWRAYLIHKRRAGTQAIESYYTTVKQAARDAGNPEFLVTGNDIPGYALGFPRGHLDMVSTEYEVGPKTHTGWTGFLLPPAGRQCAYYKLAREHGQSRFVNVWLQLTGDLEPYADQPNLIEIMFYEMLATHTTPMALPGFSKGSGSIASYVDFFGFVGAVKDVFGVRLPVADVGIYYSSSSVLAHLAPGGFYDTINQQHQLAVYGWGMICDRLRLQYRMIPEWKLDAATLAGIRVLIVPHAEVFDPADVAIVQAWVSAGGLLLVTGDSGLRAGEDGNFTVNAGGLSLAPLTGVASLTPPPSESLRDYGLGRVLYLPENRALDFFNDLIRPDALLAPVTAALATLFADDYTPPVHAATAPTTCGMTLYRDVAARKQFLDINNVDIALETDLITPTGPLTIEVDVPEWLAHPDLAVTTVSPDGPVPVTLVALEGTRATVHVGSVTKYTSVVFEVSKSESLGLHRVLPALLALLLAGACMARMRRAA
jgi:hypothetical protein